MTSFSPLPHFDGTTSPKPSPVSKEISTPTKPKVLRGEKRGREISYRLPQPLFGKKDPLVKLPSSLSSRAHKLDRLTKKQKVKQESFHSKEKSIRLTTQLAPFFRKTFPLHPLSRKRKPFKATLTTLSKALLEKVKSYLDPYSLLAFRQINKSATKTFSISNLSVETTSNRRYLALSFIREITHEVGIVTLFSPPLSALLSDLDETKALSEQEKMSETRRVSSLFIKTRKLKLFKKQMVKSLAANYTTKELVRMRQIVDDPIGKSLYLKMLKGSAFKNPFKNLIHSKEAHIVREFQRTISEKRGKIQRGEASSG